MQVKLIAECSKGNILQYFSPALSNHLSLRPMFCLFLSGRFRHSGFTVLYLISECISGDIPPQMKIVNMVIPILMHF